MLSTIQITREFYEVTVENLIYSNAQVKEFDDYKEALTEYNRLKIKYNSVPGNAIVVMYKCKEYNNDRILKNVFYKKPVGEHLNIVKKLEAALKSIQDIQNIFEEISDLESKMDSERTDIEHALERMDINTIGYNDAMYVLEALKENRCVRRQLRKVDSTRSHTSGKLLSLQNSLINIKNIVITERQKIENQTTEHLSKNDGKYFKKFEEYINYDNPEQWINTEEEQIC